MTKPSKQPRKPKTLFWYLTKLSVSDERINMQNIMEQNKHKHGHIDFPAGVRLAKWLLKAAAWAESRAVKSTKPKTYGARRGEE